MTRLKQASISLSIVASLIFWSAMSGASEYLEPEMVIIPAGKFLMGSCESEIGRCDDEGPQHFVAIPSFKLSKYEVTFEEWDACVADGGCKHSPDDRGWGRGKRPVINVSWWDAQEYITWLNRKSGKRYKLPSEAQWEYAARAGTETPFSSGECLSTDQANYNGELPYVGCSQGENRKQTLPVGTLKPNPWGLHDMHGNVWEWTADCWVDSYQGAPNDGSPRDAEGDYCVERVVRGGSWPYHGDVLRSAFRDKYYVERRNDSLGFRLAEE